MNKKNELPAWNLSDLYKSTKDPQIQKDLAEYKKKAADFAKKYKGKSMTSLPRMPCHTKITGEGTVEITATQMKTGTSGKFIGKQNKKSDI